MANEEVYIIGNGLEGVIAFEKAADENSKGSVTINPVTIGSRSIAIDTAVGSIIGTITVSSVQVSTSAGYIESKDVHNNTTSTVLTVSTPITIQSSLSASGSTVTAPAGYYYENTSATVNSGVINLAKGNTGTIQSSSNVNEDANNYNIITTLTIRPYIKTVTGTPGWVNADTTTSSRFSYTNSSTYSIPKGTALTLNSAANPPKVTAPIGWYKTAVDTTIPTANTFTLSTATPTIPTLTTGKGWYDTVTYTIPTGTVAVNPTVTFSTFNVSTNITNSGHLQVEVVASANRNAQNIHAWVPTVAKIQRSGTSNFDVDLSSIDGNFNASSIASGITIFGVKGTAGQEAPNVTVPSTLTGTDPSTKTPAATGVVTFNTTLNNVSPKVISGTVQATPTNVTLQVTGSIPVFTGSTAITPATNAVTISVANKWMPSNLTVAAIPTYTSDTIFYPTKLIQSVDISNLYATQSLTVGSVKVAGLNAAYVAAGRTVKVGNANSATAIANVTGTFTNDATATAGDILSGQTAYNNSEKITGNIQSYTPSGDVTPSTQPITIAVGGKYVTSNITIASLSAYTSANFTTDISAVSSS